MMKEQKTAIITGAGQGIGLEIASLLVRKGVQVVINDINADLANQAVQFIEKKEANARCIAMVGDSGEIDFIKKMVDGTVTHFGGIDMVIANAGITLFGDFLNYPYDDFMKVMQVNLAGTFFLAQAAANQMIRQGRGGSLLFMSSVTGHQAHKNLAAYSMSKAALEMLAKNLVIELSSYQININTIAPGATLTERTLGDKDYEATWSRITPMGRPATVTDIAEAAVFLVSDKARHITGQSLVIDGGWTSVSPSPY
ncbi:MAG: SDR family oxidoreductase [Thermoflexibacter sp.]|jgi:3-oxoacyl-[acyl-carrier protein] reductase|nr:SDR family oxidoreductase [Thermoflexibacter sp.]